MPNPRETSLNLMPMFRPSTSLASTGETTQSCVISVYMLVYESEITVIIQRINISLSKRSLINNIPSSSYCLHATPLCFSRHLGPNDFCWRLTSKEHPLIMQQSLILRCLSGGMSFLLCFLFSCGVFFCFFSLNKSHMYTLVDVGRIL